ncbi:MAG: chalcone isomerase family protein [Gammaproteobacteria bacterium]|nr:MAG: chalcone isomerase family protein [Gammaproteobacteria bacterium]
MKKAVLATCLGLWCTLTAAAELSGVFVEDEIKTGDGQTLVLNGIGLREKLWVDVYVGALYLPNRSSDVAEILSRPGPWRVQLDFVYKEVDRDKLIEAWREGFEKNQNSETLKKLQARIDQFYQYFDSSVVAKEQYAFDYRPDQGVRVSRNGKPLGTIPGEDFKNALLEIWLGNHPADKSLKKGMLGL